MFTKKNTSFLFLLIISSFFGLAQTKKTAKVIVKEAQLYFDNEDYYKAWNLYKEVLAIDEKNELAGINACICSVKLNYSSDSVAFLNTNLMSSTLIDAKYYLAKIKHQQKLFDEAITLLEVYNKENPRKRLIGLDETNYFINVCKSGVELVNKPHRSIIKNMGPEINSAFADFVPVVSPDESTMYFTSRRTGSSNNKKDVYGNYLEDVYISIKENGKWKKAENIGAPINSETNDACVAVSPDGQRMIVFRTSADGATGDLYITKIGNDNKWEPLVKMSKEVNSQFIETSACFSNDTSEIYFSSNRPGGYGGKDIYRLKRLPNGRWAMPYNLGQSINTAYDDDAPYLHPDGVSLYFSSKGHNTMGDYDVFKSVLDKETNQFSKAENLGYPINNVGNDIFFVLSVDGQRGYYSSNKEDTYGNIDIYEVDTRFGDNDLKVKSGTATKGSELGKVKITLLDNESNQVNGTYYSNPKTGKFILVMNPLKSYKAIVECEGFKTLVLDIDPTAFEKTPKDLEFKLDK